MSHCTGTTGTSVADWPASRAHQVTVQGTAVQLHAVRKHLLDQLAGHGCRIEPAAHPGPTAPVWLRLPGGGRAVLTLGSWSATLPADARTAAVTLTVTDPGADPPQEWGALLRVLDRIPLTGWEVARVVEQMPVTRRQAEHLGPEAFAGLSLLLAIHHMRDFTGMVEALVACGADPTRMTIIDKGYPYRSRDRVDGWLRHRLGATLVAYPDRADGIAAHLDRARAVGTPTLVFDDGGYVLPTVFDRFPDRVREIIGVVEQTMSGIWKLAPWPDLPVPVFSVAESRLKAAVEAPYVVGSAVRSVTGLLPEETWAGRPALVLGYGRLGHHAAALLRAQQRMRVAVYDTDPAALVAAHQDGFTVDTDLTALIDRHRPLLVLGCAGRGSLRVEHLTRFPTSAYLASMTSRDYEFPLTELAAHAERVLDYGQLGHGYLLPDGVELCVLGDGLPINFHHRESVPNRVIDLVFAALLLGGATLARPDHGGHGPGRDPELVDRILGSSPALGAYLNLYADDTAPRRLLTPPAADAAEYRRSPWIYGAR